MSQLGVFLFFFKNYFQSRFLNFGKRFEGFKNLLVAVLIVKRGKYSSSFLNTSFLLIILAAVVAGPTIAENNPFIGGFEQNPGAQAAIVSYNPYSSALGTVISAKPRDKVVDYTVEGGDTLESVSKKFGVSVDSIKWATNLKSETIKPKDVLKIPPVSGVVYKVQVGDNIYTIAKKFSSDAQKIINFPFNDFADSNNFTLTPGQTLVVPDGIPPEEKPFVAAPLFAQVQVGVKGTSNFIWPTSGVITQYPVWYHMALDIANNSSPPILASDAGTVVFAGWTSDGYGLNVIIDHNNGYRTLYAHMSKIEVSVGQAVSQGQEIGIMGSTGRSTGIHVHFEIRSGRTLLNPLDFLKSNQ